MSIEEEIVKALGAHGAWKTKLMVAIASGKSDADPAVVKQDNQCAFGKWLYSLKPDEQKSDFWRKIQRLHAEFHKDTARVLELVAKGDKKGAENLTTPGGPFDKMSSELINAMTEWRMDARKAGK